MSDQFDRQQQVQIAEQLQQQLGQLEDQYEQLSGYLEDLESTRSAVEQISEQEPGEAVLLPIGSGAFVHAKLSEVDTVLAPIGGGILAEEPPAKAKERLDARKEEAQKATDQIEQNMERLQNQLMELVQQLRGGGAPQPGAQPGQPGRAPAPAEDTDDEE